MDPRRVIVTDVDGTLTGDDDALAAFAAWIGSRRERYLLVYATGRSRSSLLDLLGEVGAPAPDAIISSVGTEIHLADGRPLPGWSERFEGWDAGRVHQALAEFPRLERQAADAQARLKASYDAADLGAADLEVVRNRLAAAGIEATIVYSGNLHLDVIPGGAGKGSAARELASAWSIPPDRVLAFGDSGNDAGLYEEGFLGTMVGNALPELRRVVGSAAYRSPYAHAGGILDGIRHWATT
jgi:sucrose-6F-phosphate phosphohydrolase